MGQRFMSIVLLMALLASCVSAEVTAPAGTAPSTVDPGAFTALPPWWLSLDAAAQAVTVREGLSGTPLIDLQQDPNCQRDMVAERVLQQHGQALLDGLAALEVDKGRAQERFVDALQALSTFTAGLYCLDSRGLQFWDHVSAGFWEDMASAAPEGFSTCQALQATWNPALVVLDAIQFTGESRIIEQFQTYASQFTACLADYPVDSYGAAWLDDLGTGRLIRVAGTQAHENLLGVMMDPRRLGLGLCSLAEHAQTASAQNCWVGLDRSLCTPSASLGEYLLEIGVGSLRVDDRPISPKGWVVDSISIQYPPAYFGTPTEALFTPSEPFMVNFCSDKEPGMRLKPSSPLPAEAACVFASFGGSEQPNPMRKIMQCTRKYAPPHAPTIESAILVDWDQFGCGTITPESGKIDTKADRAKLERMVKQAQKDGKKSATNESVSSAIQKANTTLADQTPKGYGEGVAKARKAGAVGPLKGFTIFENGKAEIYIKPGLAPMSSRGLEYHERFHVALEALGISGEGGYQEKLMKGEKIPGAHYPDYPTDTTPGSGGCHETAAAQRIRLLNECLFGEEPEVHPASGLGPLIYPVEPQGAWSGCNEVKPKKACDIDPCPPAEPTPSVPLIDWGQFWRKSTGPGVVDPLRPHVPAPGEEVPGATPCINADC